MDVGFGALDTLHPPRENWQIPPKYSGWRTGRPMAPPISPATGTPLVRFAQKERPFPSGVWSRSQTPLPRECNLRASLDAKGMSPWPTTFGAPIAQRPFRPRSIAFLSKRPLEPMACAGAEVVGPAKFNLLSELSRECHLSTNGNQPIESCVESVG